MRFMLGLGALLALASPVFAADIQREFVIECSGPKLVRQGVRRGADDWARVVIRDGEALAPWDPIVLGPYDVVARRASVVIATSDIDDETVELRLTVRMDDTNLRSGTNTIHELSTRLAKALTDRVAIEAETIDRSERTRLGSPRSTATDRRATAEVNLRLIEESEDGAPTGRAAAAVDRLLAAERDGAAVVIDRAVAAKQLDAARAAAQRALDVVGLREQADALERRAQEPRSPGQAAPNPDQLVVLRRLLAEASAKCPSLDTARERVFDLEVELVGLEARDISIAEQIKALRIQVRTLAVVARRYERVCDEVVYWTHRERELTEQFDDAVRDRTPVRVALTSNPTAPK